MRPNLRCSSFQTIHYLHRTKKTIPPTLPFSKGTERGLDQPSSIRLSTEWKGWQCTYPHTVSSHYSAYSESFFPILPSLFRFPNQKGFLNFYLVRNYLARLRYSIFFSRIPSFSTIDSTTYYTGYNSHENVRISLANTINIKCLRFQILFSRFLRQDYGLRFKNEHKLRKFSLFSFFTR